MHTATSAVASGQLLGYARVSTDGQTVEAQKHRLLENNRLLKDMGELNENILLSIESVLIVTDLQGRITQCNPLAAQWLLGDQDGSPSRHRRSHSLNQHGIETRYPALKGTTPETMHEETFTAASSRRPSPRSRRGW